MFVVESVGKKGGLVLLWKDPLMVTIQSFSMGHIDSLIEDGSIVRFTGFYDNPEVSKRGESWLLLCRLATIQEIKDVPWLVGGDFNEICNHNEKCGGRRRPENKMEEFRNVIEECEMRELYGTCEHFTWVNIRTEQIADIGDLIVREPTRFERGITWRWDGITSMIKLINGYE
ncbi:hypothetical protein DH2020_039310 [Rehmannia glutinosa]|uniref:Endonuclease/exonuclease/phosphatase domain-containing protein n=1 Tax=Rehmannia glutinosa TaxID=99300 RepID=A0ABR0UYC9_REHGL